MDDAAHRALSGAEQDVIEGARMVASLGKTVIHPGGRATTDFMFQAGRFEPHHEVLEVGCGVGTTAIRLATEKGCRVSAIDIDPALVDRARRAVSRAGLSQQVHVQQGDALTLPFDDARFDRVIVEAVLMFVERPKALDEIARVSRPGAMVLDHEVAAPDATPEDIRSTVFEGMGRVALDSVEAWENLYRSAGFDILETQVKPMAMTSPKFLIRDEGVAGASRMIARALTSPSKRRRMARYMKAARKAERHLQVMVVVARKPGD